MATISSSKRVEVSTISCEPSAPDISTEFIVPAESPEARIRRLQVENEALRRTVLEFHKRYRLQTETPIDLIPDAPSPKIIGKSNSQKLRDSLTTEEGTRAFYGQLQTHIESDAFLAKLNASRSDCETEGPTTKVSTTPVPENMTEMERWTVTADGNLVPSAPEDDDDDLVHITPSSIPPNVLSLLGRPSSETKWADPDSLDGSYVIIEEFDVIESIGEFIALYLAQIPATKQLTTRELQGLLASAFHELRDKSRFQRLWDWGKFLYATYGWGMTGLSIYREPALVMTVLRAVWTATKWGALFIIA